MKKKREFVPYSSDKIVFIFWVITDMHHPNISVLLSSRRYRYLNVFEPRLCVFDFTFVTVFMSHSVGKKIIDSCFSVVSEVNQFSYIK